MCTYASITSMPLVSIDFPSSICQKKSSTYMMWTISQNREGKNTEGLIALHNNRSIALFVTRCNMMILIQIVGIERVSQ